MSTTEYLNWRENASENAHEAAFRLRLHDEISIILWYRFHASH